MVWAPWLQVCVCCVDYADYSADLLQHEPAPAPLGPPTTTQQIESQHKYQLGNQLAEINIFEKETFFS